MDDARPAGVLALGAVFAGMVWHNSFFGDHDAGDALLRHAAVEHAADRRARPARGDAEAPAAEAGGTGCRGAGRGRERCRRRCRARGRPRRPLPGAGAPSTWPRRATDVLDEAHHAPAWVKVSPFLAMLVGFVLAYLMYIRRPELPGRIAAHQPAALRVPAQQVVLRRDLRRDLRPARPWRSAGSSGSAATARSSTAAINGVAMGIVPTFTRARGPGAVGLRLPLRLRHGHRARVLITWFTLTRRGRVTSLLSLVTFLPLVAAALLALFLRGDDAAAQRNAKWIALIDHDGDLRRLARRCSCALRPARTRLPVRRGAAVAPRADLQARRGRHLDPVRAC